MDIGGSDLIPRFRPPHSLKDLGAIFVRNKASDSITDFEKDFALAADQAHARAFPYGRTALVAVLEYLKGNFGPEKTEVICPSYTCVVVAHAIVEAGLKPVFVDCEEETLNMDWQFVGQAVSENTLAVVSTSLFGNPVKKNDIEVFRAKFPSVPIIQDCAHSFFAGNTHREGVAAIYGMNVSKLVTSVFGGMVSTDDKELADWLRWYQKSRLIPATKLRQLGRILYGIGSLVAFSRPFYSLTYLLTKSGLLGRFVDYYRPEIIDFPKDAYVQIGRFEAELGRRQLPGYSKEVLRRAEIARIYIGHLKDLETIRFPLFQPGASFSHLPALVTDPEALRLKMQKLGVELGSIVEYSVHSLPAYTGSSYFGRAVSDRVRGRIVNLPLHRGLGPKAAERIARLLKDTLER